MNAGYYRASIYGWDFAFHKFWRSSPYKRRNVGPVGIYRIFDFLSGQPRFTYPPGVGLHYSPASLCKAAPVFFGAVFACADPIFRQPIGRNGRYLNRCKDIHSS